LVDYRRVVVVQHANADPGQHAEEHNPFPPIEHPPEVELRFGAGLKSAGQIELARHLIGKSFHSNLQTSQGGNQRGSRRVATDIVAAQPDYPVSITQSSNWRRLFQNSFPRPSPNQSKSETAERKRKSLKEEVTARNSKANQSLLVLSSVSRTQSAGAEGSRTRQILPATVLLNITAPKRPSTAFYQT